MEGEGAGDEVSMGEGSQCHVICVFFRALFSLNTFQFPGVVVSC